MRHIFSYQDHISTLEVVDRITYKLFSGTFNYIYQFYFRMVMELIEKERNYIMAGAKRMLRLQVDF
jgi:hypothetical protein